MNLFKNSCKLYFALELFSKALNFYEDEAINDFLDHVIDLRKLVGPAAGTAH